MAPGTNIVSTLPRNRYGVTRGTSTAAPFVAGVVALMIHKLHKDYTAVTPKLIQELIYLNAHDIGPPGADKFTGMGIIKPEALLGSILRKSVRFYWPPR
jgi:subtilase family serine protease